MKCVLTYYKAQQILLKVLENAKKYYIIIELVKLFFFKCKFNKFCTNWMIVCKNNTLNIDPSEPLAH